MHWRSYLDSLRAALRSARERRPEHPLHAAVGAQARIPAQRDRRATATS